MEESAVDTTTDRKKDAMDSFAAAISSGMRVGREILGVVLGPAAGALSQQVDSAREMAGRAAGCSCDIPDPCWMPERLRPVASHACAGATARLRIRVTNCGLGARTITIEAQGSGSGAVQIDPKERSLGPFESGELTATVKVPDDGTAPIDVRLWVRGCRDHIVPWQVSISESGCSSTHEVAVEDCPDLVHHWYDHFYCVRPCYGGRTRLHG